MSFVVVEGCDGSGKSFQVGKTVEYLRQRLGQDAVVQSKDPGGTPLGLSLRRVMYEEVPTTQMASGVVDLIFLASHLQNWHTVVLPALLSGKTVVSDRWWYSQAAYMTERTIPRQIAEAYMSCHGDSADLLIFLHGDTRVLTDRARARESETHQGAKAWNDYDALSRIQDQYFEQFSHLPEWFEVCVDGKSQDQVWLEVQQALDLMLKKLSDTSAGICNR